MRIVVLISGSGTLLQSVLDAPDLREQVVAVGADRAAADGMPIEGVRRAERAGVETFVVSPRDHGSRADWDAALAARLTAYAPDLVVSAGFMRILGPQVLAEHTVINTHPALLPSFPGAHAVRDALAYGVRVTGTTLHVVDAGVDTGPVLEQVAVRIQPGDDEASLHERIKVAERELLVASLRRITVEGLTVAAGQARIGR